MRTERLQRILLAGSAGGLAMLALSGGASAQESLAQQLDELRRVIAEQQQTIARQQETLTRMGDRLQGIETESARARSVAAAPAPTPAVRSGQERIELSLSGHVNRMVTVANDGDDTKILNVDNDSSASRVRFVGKGRVTDDFSVGTVIEVQLESNSSAEVSQINEDTGSASFTDRKVELVFASERYGTVSLGQGDTASNGTAEVDLSGTTVIGYSGIEDMAGGLLFFDNDAGQLSDVTIGDVFSNFDGLSRRDRIRYDTPKYQGFQLSADLVSDERWSSAVRWSGDFGGVKAAAAAGYSDPGSDSGDYIVDGSGSLLHKASGLNLTLSGGTAERSNGDDPFNLYGKVGWLADLTELGPTAFGLDYTYSENNIIEDDKGTSIGFQAVQNLSDFGTEIYAGFRWYDYDAERADLDPDSITVFSVGSRVKF